MEKLFAFIALLGLMIVASSVKRKYSFLPNGTTKHAGGTTTHYSTASALYINRALMKLGILITLVGAVPLGIMKLIT